jgi:hypothetical protein
MGVLSVMIVFILRDPAATPEDTVPAQIKTPLIEIETQKPSLENLEDSRYD